MDLEQVLHMVGGSGDSSYANNSKIQRYGILKAKPLLEEALRETCTTHLPQTLVAADLGCSSSLNTIMVVSEIVNTVDDHCRRQCLTPPEVQIFLNDLPSNDFNTVFESLMMFQKQIKEEKDENFLKFYACGLPGSFYGRLFPSRSVHFFNATYSIMWLSQVPRGLGLLNEKNVYIPATTSSTSSIVLHLYYEQFKRDFTIFLKSRSKELVLGGRIILTILGRRNYENKEDPSNILAVVADALNDMVNEELIGEDDVSNFNMPYYTPTFEEVKCIIEMEGSFKLDKAQIFTYNFAENNGYIEENKSGSLRATMEPLLISHFGFGSELMKDLFLRCSKKMAKYISNEMPTSVNFILVLSLSD